MTIIDFKKKFIFIANEKTGSTSFHNYYKNFLSNDKIYSARSKNTRPIGKHFNYQNIKNYLDKRKINIDDFYIFGFIRNPVERIKSCFCYEKMRKRHKYYINNQNYNKYIKNNDEKHFSPINEVFYNENNKLPNNVHIFKIENINESIKIINKTIGINNNTKFPFLNVSKKQDLIITSKKLEILKKRYKLDFSYYPDILNKQRCNK